MEKTVFTVYLDTKVAVYDGKEFKELHERVLGELCNKSSSLVIPLEQYGETKFSIEKINKEKIENEHLLRDLSSKNVSGIRDPKEFLKTDLLKISCDIDVPVVIPQDIKDSWSDEDKEIFNDMDDLEFNLSYIYEIIKKRIYDIIFAINLAKVGGLSVNKYIIFQDNNDNIMAGKEIDYRSFFRAKKSSETWGYPPLEELKIMDVWEWLVNYPDFLLGFSKFSTSRALINLSEIHRADENMKLFRAVMGIEALYTKGSGNLQEQVRQKSQTVLGVQQEFKKLYNNMYTFRSKYIHGELNIASTIHLDLSHNIAEYSEKLRESIDFAIVILISSIQQLIVRKWGGFSFSYKVENQ